MKSRKNRVNIKHPERSLLTDTCPYELPLFMTNANFATFANKPQGGQRESELHNQILLSKSLENTPATKPYRFSIHRDTESRRQLALPHPRSQHLMSQFYASHELFICNVCSRSEYSLRFPSRIATRYLDPRYVRTTPVTRTQGDEDPIGFSDQSKWASTHFSYRKYNLLYKFFESEELLGLERRFSYMLSLDVSRCFESIYTHSIEWSVRGKDFAKRNKNRGKDIFEAQFDRTIRHANWDETHGIVVGPEFSRIFAEVLLQGVDQKIQSRVKNAGLQVEVRRYVDDYYIFGNDETSLKRTEAEISDSLNDVNLHLNQNKRTITPRPFTTKISSGRKRVADIFVDLFETVEAALRRPDQGLSSRITETSQNRAISAFRRVSVELATPYRQLVSYGLSVVFRQLSRLVEAQSDPVKKLSPRTLTALSWMISIVRISQFLYSVDQRATTSIKLAQVYTATLRLADLWSCDRAPIESQILDGLRNSSDEASYAGGDQVARINHICSVDLLLTPPRRIEPSDLVKQMDFSEAGERLEMKSLFQLLCILFVCRKRTRFRNILRETINEMKRRLHSSHSPPHVDTETCIMLTELIACPYVDTDEKVAIVAAAVHQVIGRNCSDAEATAIIESHGWISFVDWKQTSNLEVLLARRELTPAYD